MALWNAVTPPKTRYLWFMLGLLALLSFASFAIPMYVIRPFRAQGPRELELALAVRQYGPPVAIFAALAAVALTLLFWERWKSRIARALAVAATSIAVLFAVFSHINVYELMFHPAGAPLFEPASSAKIDGDDMVLAVKIQRDARAYPIRTMGYHHIVNDWAAGVPIAATY